MVITKQEFKSLLKGVLIAAGTWMIIIPVNSYLIEVSPVKNSAILGIAVLIGVAIWD